MDAKTKPIGSLGRLETFAVDIAIAQGTLSPRLEHCDLFLFAGDHGLAHENVSAYPQAVTRQMVMTFLSGGAASTVIARELGIDVTVVDCGVAGEILDLHSLVNCRIASGTKNSLHEPAMSVLECEQALGNGSGLIRRSSAEAVAMGEMGIANSSAAALVASKTLGLPVAELVGRGTGLGDAAFRRKQEVVVRASRRTAESLAPLEALRQYGGFEMATMVGAMLEGARMGRLVIVDGYIATSAAICALALASDLRQKFVFAHQSAEHGHARMLSHVSATPLLRLEMRLGEGTGALLAWPVLRAAAAVMRSMASFDEAGVSGPTV